MGGIRNIAEVLREQAALAPERVALHYPVGAGGQGVMTFRELDAESDAMAAGLAAIGVGRGVRTALMVKPGREFFVLIYALFKAGAIPVLIDPGIDRRALRACLAEAEPAAFIGIPLAHAARIALGWARASVRVLVTVGRRWFWGGHTYDALLELGTYTIPGGRDATRLTVGARGHGGPSAGVTGRDSDGHPVRDAFPDVDATPVAHRVRSYSESGGAPAGSELAAILFTSGSTGIPKGVEYTHANFAAQVEMIRRAFDLRAGEVDLATFAPFALFDPALGMTCVLPRMDFARPGSVSAQVLADAVARHRATTMFGSPAVVEVLARDGATHAAQLAGLKRIISAGAPVRPEIVRRLHDLLPGTRVWTPYGATECLPVAVVEGREILALGAQRTPQGGGILVGTPLPGNTVRIIRIADEPLPLWADSLRVADGVVGEITVAGPSVTRRYFRRDAATAAAKIEEALDESAPPRVVHRMGDLGYFDAQGLLWYCGRKSHRVEAAAGPLYTEQVEGVFNAHPAVQRTALVGLGAYGAQTPVLCVELAAPGAAGHWPRIRAELATLGATHRDAARIEEFLLHPRFPVDIRHNAKIGREHLAAWARTRVVGTLPVGDHAP